MNIAKFSFKKLLTTYFSESAGPLTKITIPKLGEKVNPLFVFSGYSAFENKKCGLLYKRTNTTTTIHLFPDFKSNDDAIVMTYQKKDIEMVGLERQIYYGEEKRCSIQLLELLRSAAE